MVSRSESLADVVAIEDGGTLTWFTGNVSPLPLWGTGWQHAVQEPSFTRFDPGVRPALISVADHLVAAAVDGDGRLFTVDIDATNWPDGITAARAIDPGVTLGNTGPVALAAAGPNVVALGVDAGGTLRATTRPLAGGFFTNLFPVGTNVTLSPRGGVSAVSLPNGVMAIVTDNNGVLWFTVSPDGILWSPITEIDWRQNLPVL